MSNMLLIMICHYPILNMPLHLQHYIHHNFRIVIQNKMRLSYLLISNPLIHLYQCNLMIIPIRNNSAWAFKSWNTWKLFIARISTMYKCNVRWIYGCRINFYQYLTWLWCWYWYFFYNKFFSWCIDDYCSHCSLHFFKKFNYI